MNKKIGRNCLSLELFDKKSIEYQSYSTRRGYKPKHVKMDFDKVRSTPRDTFLTTKSKSEQRSVYPLLVDYNPRQQNIGKLIRDHLPILHSCSIMVDLFPSESIFPAFRRPRNLKEILSKRIDSCRATDNPAIETGFFCCSRKCGLCTNFAIESSNFSSVFTGRTYDIKQSFLHL